MAASRMVIRSTPSSSAHRSSAPRSAGPGLGRARSPRGDRAQVRDRIEDAAYCDSGRLTACEPRWSRGPEDIGGHQETTNVEVSGRSAAIHLERKCPGLRFHTTTATSAVLRSDDLPGEVDCRRNARGRVVVKLSNEAYYPRRCGDPRGRPPVEERVEGERSCAIRHPCTPPARPTITTGLRGVPPGADDDASRPTRTTPAPQRPPS